MNHPPKTRNPEATKEIAMLLRQALEQTRAGMPAPVLFNSHSRKLVLDPIDEVSAMWQKDVFDVHFHTVHNRASIRSFLRSPGGQAWQGQPHRRAATASGVQA